MKKSQTTLFFLFGIVLIIILFGILLTNLKKEESFLQNQNKRIINLKDTRADFSKYIDFCIKDSAEQSIQDTGIRQETIEQYKTLVISRIETCTNDFFLQLKNQNYEITEGEINIGVEYNPETVIVDINYPITVEYQGGKVNFQDFNYVFDREESVKIPNGIADKEIILTSSNKKAQLIIPKGTKITDKDGNPIETVAIKVEDLHFDGLENKYVLGQLVYNNLPNGLIFSQPVDFSIEFRKEDIPSEYTENNIMIAYWNNETGIWFAVDTEIKDNKAIAKITHFTHFSLLFVKFWIIENKLFEQRFAPFGSSTDTSKVWAVGGGENKDFGTVSLQEEFVDGGPSQFLPDLNANFKDYKKIYERLDFLAHPEIKYGYFENPNNPKDDEFTDCESDGQKVEEGVTYFFEDSYPYFFVEGCPNYKCSPTENCPLDNSSFCNNKNYCSSYPESPDSNQVCMPYISGSISTDVSSLNSGNFPCCPIEKSEVNFINSKEKVFGWHNYQCVGGKVRPGEEGINAADFIIFGTRGNAVLYVNDQNLLYGGLSKYVNINVFAKPPSYWPWYKGEGLKGLEEDAIGLINIFRTLVLKEDISSELEGLDELPFYCSIKPYPGTGEIIQLIESDNIPSSIKEKLNAKPRDTISAYGIYGLDIIKRKDHPTATKSELHTQCWVYWSLIGNGFYTNPPEDVSITLSDTVMGKFSNILNDKIPDKLKSLMNLFN